MISAKVDNAFMISDSIQFKIGILVFLLNILDQLPL